MSEWGKGERKTSRRRKNKRRNPRKGKGTRGPRRPRSGLWASRAGPHYAAQRTMDRALRLRAGAAHTPLEGGGRKSEPLGAGPVPLR